MRASIPPAARGARCMLLRVAPVGADARPGLKDERIPRECITGCASLDASSVRRRGRPGPGGECGDDRAGRDRLGRRRRDLRGGLVQRPDPTRGRPALDLARCRPRQRPGQARRAEDQERQGGARRPAQRPQVVAARQRPQGEGDRRIRLCPERDRRASQWHVGRHAASGARRGLGAVAGALPPDGGRPGPGSNRRPARLVGCRRHLGAQ